MAVKRKGKKRRTAAQRAASVRNLAAARKKAAAAKRKGRQDKRHIKNMVKTGFDSSGNVRTKWG